MHQIRSCKPRRDRLLLDRKTMSEKTEGGIIIPDQVREKAAHFGKVLSAGPEVEGILPGDLVVVGKFAGIKVKDMEGEYLIVSDEEVLLHLPCDDLGFTLKIDITEKTEPVTTRSGLAALIEACSESEEYVMALGVTMQEDGTWLATTGEGSGTVEDLLNGKIESESF